MKKIIEEEVELNSDMIEQLDYIENAAQRIIVNEIHGKSDDIYFLI